MPFDFTAPDLRDAAMTIVVATTAALPCALLGCFLMLKKMSLLADAVGHGVLPGIALAALFSGQISGPAMFLGAAIFGVFTAVAAQWLTDRAGVSSDAGLGVVFTTLFALGVVIISVWLGKVHIDLHCISFAKLEMAPLFTTNWFGILVPETLGSLLLVLAVVVIFLGAFWKELELSTFDPGLARSLGLSVVGLHYGLVALTAGATVAAFESFGSILVLGMFVLPPATARMVTESLHGMLFASAAFTVSACVIGCVLASLGTFGGSASGLVVVAAGAQLFLVLLFAPRHGAVSAGVRRLQLVRRVAEEEILATLYRAEEKPGRPLSPHDHAFPSAVLRFARWNLGRKKLVVDERLTDQGRKIAQSVVRAHRLWEAYLEKNFGLPLDHLHAAATEMEHFLGPEVQSRLAEELAAPGRDPHGQQIPDPERTDAR